MVDCRHPVINHNTENAETFDTLNSTARWRRLCAPPPHFPHTEHKFSALRTIQRKVVRGSPFVDMSQLRLTCVLIDFRLNEIYVIGILQDSVTVMQRLQVSSRHNKRCRTQVKRNIFTFEVE